MRGRALSARRTPKNPPAPAKLVQMGGEPPVHVHDPLVVFFYLLLRDELPAGAVEGRVQEIEDAVAQGSFSWALSNGYLVGYAQNVFARLSQGMVTTAVAHAERLRVAERHIEALLRAPEVSESDAETDVAAARRFLTELAPRVCRQCGAPLGTVHFDKCPIMSMAGVEPGAQVHEGDC